MTLDDERRELFHPALFKRILLKTYPWITGEAQVWVCLSLPQLPHPTLTCISKCLSWSKFSFPCSNFEFFVAFGKFSHMSLHVLIKCFLSGLVMKMEARFSYKVVLFLIKIECSGSLLVQSSSIFSIALSWKTWRVPGRVMWAPLLWTAKCDILRNYVERKLYFAKLLTIFHSLANMICEIYH